MSNNIQQTAVEWLESIFYSQSKSVGFDKWVIIESEMDRIIDKAKEMEKEQIKNAHDEGYGSGYMDDLKSPEQYYNETYGGNNE